jgi:pyrroloquinoline quinone biosynthesis protein D
VNAAARPTLRRGVRLAYDRTRQRHVVLFPEGVLVLNDTAAAVLRHCDGDTDLDGIVGALRSRYDGVVAEDVRAVLDRLAERGVVTWT